MFDPAGKVASVTGGNGGIGLAMARTNWPCNACSGRSCKGTPFLASSESDFVTGAAIPVDGGDSIAQA